ncbi:MAG TPA: ectonucleotide pyrophosphatase/phosphodiesterase [Gemmatimonadaceae bacterium]|jgi:predicted AlkP superfamily pyrophosphatase or phosphodiesterase|nr:ectonucleotide pyrophosphatase/phosphodiesterase [Gemmatimonadaceae bacterium]
MTISMTPRRRTALALVLLAAGACSGPKPSPGPTPSPNARARTVIVLGFDGFARRYLDSDSAPALHALAREGVSTSKGMIPSFPTVTFPNWYAMATGLYPDHTGIVNNRFYDPAYKDEFIYKNAIAHEAHWWGGEPIWVTATKQGTPAGTMFWVGSDAPIMDTRPAHWHSYDHGIPFSARIDTLFAWLDLPIGERPRLLMGYFEEPDTQGHNHGPDAPETREAVLRVDSALAQLVSGLKARKLYDSVDIVILADHGMAEISPQRRLYLDDVVDSANVDVVNLAPNLMISARDGDNDALLAKLKKLPHFVAWKKSDIPARLHYGTSARIPAIVGIADAGWMIEWRHGKPYDGRGEHGYDNANLDMRALFLARGPDFKSGATIGEFPNVDVYDLLARLLGIRAAPNDGEIAPFLSVLK